MNLTRLRYFIAVAETQNVVRAAKALNVAQPALSRQLKALETSIGSPLFERHPRGMTLTPAGAALLTHAREAVKAADNGIAAARLAGAATVVNVSAPDWPHRSCLVADAAHELKVTNPEIEVVFNTAPWTVSEASLRSGIIDIGFTIAPSADQFDDDIAAELLIPEPGPSAVLPSRHPLAKRQSVRLIDMKDLPALIPPRDKVTHLHDQMSAVIRSGGYEPKIVDAPLNYSAATQLVAVGAGWIITPDSTAEQTPPGTVVLPIDDLRITLGFYVLRRSDDARPSVLALIEALRLRVSRI